MRRRNSGPRPSPAEAPPDAGAGEPAPTTIIDDLVAQLNGGSGVAATRLRALARDTDAPAGGGGGTRTAVLDRVAAAAAAGSPYSLELLVGLVVELDLAGGAIGRVAGGQPATVIDDIRQEVLVAIARSIRRYRGEARFTTWLYAVAGNVAVSHLRRIRPTVELGPEAVLSDGAQRRMSSVVTERDLVYEAIRSLPPQYRTTVHLRDIEGLSYAEIAERQGIEINTVRSRLARGRALMARRMP